RSSPSLTLVQCSAAMVLQSVAIRSVSASGCLVAYSQPIRKTPKWKAAKDIFPGLRNRSRAPEELTFETAREWGGQFSPGSAEAEPIPRVRADRPGPTWFRIL